jgi:hypothetical protein
MIKIYALTDPITNEPQYIGKTINELNFRLRKHIETSLRYRKSIKDCWIVSLNKKCLKPNIELIDIVPQGEWKFWEKHYICLYKSWGFCLRNGTEGGDGTGKSFRHTKTTLDKIHAKTTGEYHWMKKGLTDKFKAHLKKLHEGNKGRTCLRKNITYADSYGTEKAESIKKQFYVPILQYDLNGVFLNEWESSISVETELKIKRTNICHALKGRRNQVGGYVWKYKIKA